MRHPAKIIPFLILLIVAIKSNCVWACSCAELMSPEVAFSKASAVFTGEVIKITEVNPYFVDVQLKISKNFKGTALDSIIIGTEKQGTMCGYNFKEGGEYLIYAYQGADGSYSTDICTRTKKLSHDAEDQEEFERMIQPVKDIKKNGIIKTFDDNGKLEGKWNFNNDALDGLSTTYYPEGNLYGEWNYKNGQSEGIAKTYHKNGNVYEVRNYKNGKPEGVQKTYHENGKLRLEENYKSGKLLSKKKYDLEGNLISSQ